MLGGHRAQAVPAQAIVESGNAGFARFGQRQLDGFFAAPARPVQVAAERRTATRARKLPRSLSVLFPGRFRQVFIRRLMCLSDL